MSPMLGAIGWKVNGAGGGGDSLTILSGTPEAKDALDQSVAVLDTRYRVLPVQISTDGLQVQGALQFRGFGRSWQGARLWHGRHPDSNR